LYKIPANTLFIGKNLVFVPECHSTNTLALQLSQQPGFADGSVVVTSNQTAGRGQRGNIWVVQPGVNLTFSIILKPSFLTVKEQFWLTIITSLAVQDFVQSKVADPAFIKWPNDILVRDKKICGILIENQIHASQIQSSVIGIGLNVNQADFGFHNATSLKMLTLQETDLNDALHLLLQFLEARYVQLKQQQFRILRQQYLSALYWKGEQHLFSVGGTTFAGVIDGIDEHGKLNVKTDNEIRSFEVKELVYLS
jgi:BirA family transcriptional regulator, biotin operon repressor / biotin---[acetyl-CoA-carboxylase] ligase